MEGSSFQLPAFLKELNFPSCFIKNVRITLFCSGMFIPRPCMVPVVKTSNFALSYMFINVQTLYRRLQHIYRGHRHHTIHRLHPLYNSSEVFCILIILRPCRNICISLVRLNSDMSCRSGPLFSSCIRHFNRNTASLVIEECQCIIFHLSIDVFANVKWMTVVCRTVYSRKFKIVTIPSVAKSEKSSQCT